MDSLTYRAHGREQVTAAIQSVTGCTATRAAALVDTAGTLASLRDYTVAEIEAYLTPPQAARLLAAFRLGRAVVAADGCRDGMRHPVDVAAFVRATIGEARQECFLVIGLDARQKVVRGWVVGLGSLAQVDVHPREVFRPVMLAGCHSVILAHNHPSGDTEPSSADVDITTRLSEVGRLVGVPVLDHLVVTPDDHASLAALGLLPA